MVLCNTQCGESGFPNQQLWEELQLQSWAKVSSAKIVQMLFDLRGYESQQPGFRSYTKDLLENKTKLKLNSVVSTVVVFSRNYTDTA